MVRQPQPPGARKAGLAMLFLLLTTPLAAQAAAAFALCQGPADRDGRIAGGSRAEIIRRPDGSIGWLRWGGRIHKRAALGQSD